MTLRYTGAAIGLTVIIRVNIKYEWHTRIYKTRTTTKGFGTKYICGKLFESTLNIIYVSDKNLNDVIIRVKLF